MADAIENDTNEKLAELVEENKLLHTQAKLLSAELEKYYKRFREIDAERDKVQTVPAVSGEKIKELEKAFARLKAKEDALKKLLHGQDAAYGDFAARPKKMKLILAGGYSNYPTAALGGEAFGAVLSAYKKGGIKAVKTLLTSEPITDSVQARALTALAKEVRKTDARAASAMAMLAWQLDPQPFRLKWLAFRMHEAGDAVLAEALIDMLPSNIELQSNEKERIKRIRKEADCALLKNLPALVEKPSITPEYLQTYVNRIEKLVSENTSLKISQMNMLATSQKEAEYLQEKMEKLEARLMEASNRIEDQKLLLNNREMELSQAYARYDMLESVMKNAMLRLEENYRHNMTSMQKEYECLLEKLAQTANTHNDAWKELTDRLDALGHNLDTVTKNLGTQSALIDQNFGRINDTCAQLDASMREGLQRTAENLEDRCAKLDINMRERLENKEKYLDDKFGHMEKLSATQTRKALRQLIAFDGLKQYFNGGGLPSVELWEDGWPASPDFMLNLVRMLDQGGYDLIVEFGSGYSTLFLAKIVAWKKNMDAGCADPEIVSFEHKQEYFQKTANILAEAGLAAYVQLIYAPLEAYHAPDGGEFSYYACQEVLAQLGAKYGHTGKKVLVIVDGPPGMTCRHARYPAFPLIMRYLFPASIDFIMDDYGRTDEREIIDKWQTICESGGIPCKKAELDFEKGACSLSVNCK